MEHQTLIKRLKYRSWHRGCKETDLILGNFSDTELEKMTEGQLQVYEALLEEDDAHIWDWLNGKAAPTNPAYLPLLEILKDYGVCGN
jgi:antitoxin CptB